MSAQLAIVGLPGCGKTTLADALGAVFDCKVVHTDDVKELPWNEQAAESMNMVEYYSCHCHPVLVVEGITVARMFRRGFEPDCVLWVLGGDPARSTKSLRSLIDRGLSEYSGRVVTVPFRPQLDTVLWALGSGSE